MSVPYSVRDIAAPEEQFCLDSDVDKLSLQPVSNVSDASDVSDVSDAICRERQDYYKVLESISNMKYEDYCGPTPESNWVIPGVLMAGAFPATVDDGETFKLLTSILKLGVTKFVCLQLEYNPVVPEYIWRNNSKVLRPYFNDVQQIVENKEKYEALRDIPNIVTADRLSFEHCPIKDCSVTDDSIVLELAKKLVHAIRNGDVIYLHCWGGHGRTGTVVCIMLHLMYGMNDIEAMTYCQTVHDLREYNVNVGSPQTQVQRNQVTRIIHHLIAENDSASSSSQCDTVFKKVERLTHVYTLEELKWNKKIHKNN